MSKTKIRLAMGLKQLILVKDFKKITVQDIVERSNLTRQTFYYYFQDIYETLEWLCVYELMQELDEENKEPLEEWLFGVVKYMSTNGAFYRRLIGEVNWGTLEAILRPIIRDKVSEAFLTSQPQRFSLEDGEVCQDFMVEFFSSSFVNYMFIWISKSKPESEEVMMKQIRYLLTCLRTSDTVNV